MEFNIEAARAGARLRRGVREHTLSVGDHDVTAMINGSDAQLQRLAFDILTETGVTVDNVNQLAGRKSTTELITRIAVKAKELGGEDWRYINPPVDIRFSADSQQRGYTGWTASVVIKPARKPNRYASACGRTVEEALTKLATEIGL